MMAFFTLVVMLHRECAKKKHEEKQQRSRFGLSFQVSIEGKHFIFTLLSVDWLQMG